MLKRRSWWQIVAVCFCLGMLSVWYLSGNIAGKAANVAGGTCGADLTWVLDEQGVLTIEGTGEMKGLVLPWEEYRDSLKEVIIKEGATNVSTYAFQGYPNLTKVTLPSTITKINQGAFGSCGSLSSINIPKNVKSIGMEAFRGCSSLKQVTFPDGLQFISSSAFASSGLTSVKLPASLTEVYNTAFTNCNSLISVEVGVGTGSMILYGEVFARCDKLESVVLGKAVKKMENGGHFQDCPNLSTVTLGSELENVAFEAFLNCTSLKEITIPDSVTKMGSGLYGRVFEGCSALEKITIGYGVTELGPNEFKNCTSLKEIYFCGDAPAFNGTTTMEGVTATAYYPEKNTTWKAYNMVNHGTGTIEWKTWVVPVSHFAPTLKSTTNTSKGIQLKWEALDGANGYEVYRKNTSGWEKVKTTTSLSWTDTSAKGNGTKYQYRVYAYDEFGKSKASGTLTHYYVTGVSLASVKNEASLKLTATWKKNTKASGYQIQYASDSAFKNAGSVAASKSATSKTISKLKKGTTYYVRIRAYKTVSGKKFYSNWSSTKKIKISK